VALVLWLAVVLGVSWESSGKPPRFMR
jgi:hypothetical protein